MSKPKILIVDDKEANLFALDKLLRSLEVEVIKANSGKEALGLSLAHDFCLAIVDVQMPGMDGYELVELLRSNESTSRLPVIFVSAIYSDEYHHRKAYGAGAVDFISKPFVPEILLSKAKVFIALDEQRRELKSLMGRLQESNARLQELNSQKDRFIGMAVHDLLNPIGIIIGLNDVVRAHAARLTQEEIEKALGDINRQARYMLALIEDLLDVSQIESGALSLRLRGIELSEFLTEIIFRHHQSAVSSKGSHVRFEGEHPAQVLIDPIRMRQVVDNLVSNAVKYSPSRSQILVTTERLDLGWRINVHDEGPGIEMEERDRLFTLFGRLSTTPTNGEKSTGLGLAIASRVVEAHGGQIGVDSTPGQGSIFWFVIPDHVDGELDADWAFEQALQPSDR